MPHRLLLFFKVKVPKKIRGIRHFAQCRRHILIGNCFLDAARFRENCFCVQFIFWRRARVSITAPRFFAGLTKDTSVAAAGRADSAERRASGGRGRAHTTCVPPVKPAGKITRALGSSSVGEDVFVVRHRIHVVARLAGPGPGVHGGRSARRGQQRRAVPLAQVAEDFFDHDALGNHRNHARRVPALRAEQRVSVPDLLDKVASLFRGQFRGRQESERACPVRCQKVAGSACGTTEPCGGSWQRTGQAWDDQHPDRA